MRLIDIHSITFGVVSSLLSRLESPKNIIVTSTATQTLEAFLPRFRLTFFVNANWELECRSMPGYIVDKSQSCGTMFGLTNKLILRPGPTSSEDSLLPRRVIIPQGVVSFRKCGDFTSISIITDAKQHVRWHEYTIDADLRCLTSNTSLSSKLYQCYLHALTSHCLPDPLLGHTGTEEALYILQSASCRSFPTLNFHQAKLLELISNLTPKRDYYPHHLESMATVKWNDLPALSQHHGFFWTVSSLFDHARALAALYDQPAVLGTLNRDQLLLNRAAFRNKSYYPSDSQVMEGASSVGDVTYESRDVSDLGSAECVAFQTTWSILNGRPSLDSTSRSLWDIMKSWGSLGPSDREVSLRYSRHWLKFDASRDWFVIYDLCRKAMNGGIRNSRIKLSFSLSAAAYSKSKYSEIVPILMIFSLDERCCDLSPPPDHSYTLSDGLGPRLTHLNALISKSALDIDSTPAHTLRVSWRQKCSIYHETVRRHSSPAATSILDQWPHYQHVDLPNEWFDKAAFNQRIKEYSESISRNIGLREHVGELQGVLRKYMDVSIPTADPYTFSPQFITSHSRAPSYSLCDVLASRTDIPPSSITEGVPPRVGPDNLKILIEELCRSQLPLKALYGNELNMSHCELLRQNAQGAIPSHELLVTYRDECSLEKHNIFSDISVALAPSQNMETINGVADLWPRITPRSLLRQLARDRISRLPDQWRSLIMRFAISLLKYRHSLRLLELSSGQRHDELLRETESLHKNVLAESSPDWLLIQVRLLSCS